MTCLRPPPTSTKSLPGEMVSASVASSSSTARNWSKYATASFVPNFTVPASGSISPRISLRSVDFPQPLGPTRPTLSPRSSRAVKSATTSLSP